MNEVQPLVSILVPAYNHGKYVRECLQSIIDQDYPRMELLVIDDGSTDDTWAQINDMRTACESRFERVVLETQRNQGCRATWCRLSKMAHGDIAGLIASDDRYLPGAVTKLVRPLVEDDEVGLSVGTNIIIDSDGRRCCWDKRRNNVYDATAAVYRTFDEFLQKRCRIAFESDDFGDYGKLIVRNHVPNGYFVRQSLMRKAPFFDPDAPLEDWWFHLQLSKLTRYRHIDDETFCYRWHGANTATDSDKMARMAEATLFRERNLLLARGDPVWLAVARKTFRHVQVARRINFGLGRISIKEVRTFDSRQRFIKICGLTLPISARSPW